MSELTILFLLFCAAAGVAVGTAVSALRSRADLAGLGKRAREMAPPDPSKPDPGHTEALHRVLDQAETLLFNAREDSRQGLGGLSDTLKSLLDTFEHPARLWDPDLQTYMGNWASRQPAWEAAARELAEQRRDLVQQALEQDKPLDEEILFRGLEGEPGVLRIRVSPLRDPEGRVFGALELLRDVTGNKRDQERMEQLEFVINSTRDSMTMIGPDHTYLTVNDAYLERSGMTRDQVVGKHLNRVWGRKTYENIIRPHLERAFAGEEAQYESWFGFPDRETRYYQVTYTPCCEADGSVSRVVVVSRDITNRHQAEQALKEAREKLEERVRERTAELTRANVNLLNEINERRRLEERLTEAKDTAERASRVKGEFLANMSHEVRTPLSAIAGIAEIGRDTVADDDVAHLFRTILSEAGGLMNVLNTVLDFSKIEAGKLTLERMPFDLRYLVEDTAAGFAPQAQRKGLELITAIRPRTPGNLVGDPGRLRQILVNVLGNAVKFTDKGEVSVVVDLVRQDKNAALLRFEVRDTGIGIPLERQGVVFESFTQADGTTSRTHGGTGLGTTIAKELTEAMGGSMGLTSTPGEGSLFWFTVRFGLQNKARSRVAAEPGLPGLSILVVDDNPLSMRTMAEHITAWGARATTARSAEQALDLLAQAQAGGDSFDILITDLAMPDTDGFALAREVRSRREYDSVPIVLLTGAAMIGHGETCREIGIQAYLPKPVRREDLNRALRAVLTIGSSPAEDGEDRLITKHRLAESRGPIPRVLLVEDHSTNRDVALHHLERLGLDATVAVNGQEAVDLFGRMAFDLVLMDIQMPVMDGFEATRALRAKEARVRRLVGDKEAGRTPVLALTAHAGAEFRQRCLDAGMDDHLLKPLSRATLEAVLAKWLPDHALPDQEVEPAPAGLVDTDAPMDIARAVQEFNNDEEFMRSLTRTFLDRSEDQADGLSDLAEQDRIEDLADEAHAIKGGAANLAAGPLAQAARALENLARSGDQDPDEHLAGVRLAVAELKERLDELRAFVERAWGPDPD